MKEIFPCLVACGLVEDNMDAYTMQISGERSYIAGDSNLLEFKDIRRYIGTLLLFCISYNNIIIKKIKSLHAL